MGSKLKLIAGFFLFVIGVFIGYETIAYRLVDVLLVLAFILAMAGLISMVSYFVDTSIDKTSGILKDVLNSTAGASSSLKRSNDSSSSQPLKVRKEFNDYYGEEEGSSMEEIPEITEDFTIKSSLDDFADDEDGEFTNQLNFTPNYDKPLKVTRKPKKRSDMDYDYGYESDYDEIPVYTEVEDKSEEIKRALLESDAEEDYIRPSLKKPSDKEYRDIKLDINDPEALPVPKSLRSFVVSDEGFISSDEAFEKLTDGLSKEMMLEIPSLKDLSDRFLSQIPTIYSRLIIEDFDVSDMSYAILIASLLKQGVHIKTIPRVNAINMVADDSHALIVSDSSESMGDVEYGAIYDDRDAISQIRSSFDRAWNVASDLDENIIMSSVEG